MENKKVFVVTIDWGNRGEEGSIREVFNSIEEAKTFLKKEIISVKEDFDLEKEDGEFSLSDINNLPSFYFYDGRYFIEGVIDEAHLR